MLSLMRRPRLEAAAAMAATRLGSAPLDSECAMGNPSLDASSTPFNSGMALRRDSIWLFRASTFAMQFSFFSTARTLRRALLAKPLVALTAHHAGLAPA